MNDEERKRLSQELTDLCRRYHPQSGPHTVEEVGQDFDYYRMEQSKRIEHERAGALQVQNNPSVHALFDQKQKATDKAVDRAEQAVCRANKLPYQEPEREAEERGRGDSGGNGDSGDRGDRGDSRGGQAKTLPVRNEAEQDKDQVRSKNGERLFRDENPNAPRADFRGNTPKQPAERDEQGGQGEQTGKGNDEGKKRGDLTAGRKYIPPHSFTKQNGGLEQSGAKHKPPDWATRPRKDDPGPKGPGGM